jgi:hypothetical protein
MLQQTTIALQKVVGCATTYVAAFGEKPGFEHLHVHVVPRMSDFDPQHLGTGVFEFLRRPETEWVAADTRDVLALALREAFPRSGQARRDADQH